ncbi:bifunctional riboflavin kinase/FAD synthetase [Streptococcus sp. 27098_8_23]|uniref:Riboflavin biosynthesis protein n=1 Tax=Streptococcus oralis TaxID=1303 RepID=A0A3R9I7F1_STROR|nr:MULTISPECIES: bifunctional riboflavin kinase/FAD synthetase [Streptococcus]MCY7073826.1 bifunctional riboflavin kinase/FAD synthetase [Streptococcus oralis]OFL47712.1 bifunctional riboflavin kinase/FMN adenylyltransferase [Streptococcus sp. HMSC076C08]OFP32408.1 bifunctional riboflavin kinase/FMN adenylyltransferase [Streptococcus sp. HMSC072D07]ORO70358.1 riboflavin biosynthesis protein RibF [Streptococcus oralis subsp. oralis]RSI71613.1 Riboflavin biosynthesis protein RibF [Streptococcus 
MITTVPIKNEKDIAVPGKTVLVLGYFDGIHKGHQKLFEVASKASMKDYLPVVVMTFTESPKLALQPYQPELMLHIVNHEEREHKMKWHGVEALFLLDFSSKFANLTGQEFFDTYVRALKPAIIVAGFDYTFGSDKKAADDLKDYFDGEIIIVPPVEDEKGKISSTRIRQAILDGDVKEVNHLLGTPLPSRGMVVHGNARGRTIGYPTANLVLRDRTYMPADGVYVVDIEVQRQRYRGMASVGKNVTFDGEEPRFEVNIFDFSDDIYGETVMVYWLDRIRDMVKFDSIDELVDQLQKDEEIARNWKDGESVIQGSQV